MNRFLASACQYQIQLGNITQNLSKLEKLLAVAGGRHSKIVVLPEMFASGFLFSQMQEIAKISGDILRFLQEKALQYQFFLIGGTLPVIQQSSGKLFNRSYLISPTGGILGDYDKHRAFFGNHENDYFCNGTKVSLFATDLAKIGILICYDLRFPELARDLTQKGMEILVVPALFPDIRLDHWLTLLKARAIENQIYVIAANGLGKDSTYTYAGHSIIVSPEGRILVNGVLDETVISDYIDIKELQEYRDRFPVLKGLK